MGKILIVEDDEGLLELLSDIFSGATNHTICVARDGREALNTTKTARPDLLVLDVMLPEKDGFEVCSILKNDPKFAHIKILMLTSLTQASQKTHSIEVGADAYITKPFKPLTLIMTAEQLLGLIDSSQ